MRFGPYSFDPTARGDEMAAELRSAYEQIRPKTLLEKIFGKRRYDDYPTDNVMIELGNVVHLQQLAWESQRRQLLGDTEPLAPSIFDFLDELTDRLQAGGHYKRAQNIKAGYSRATGGVDFAYITGELVSHGYVEKYQNGTENERRRLLRVVSAAEAFVQDLKRRHPGEQLQCPFIVELDNAVKGYHHGSV